MNKRGLILKIILIVFVVLIIAAVAAGIYFYNFYVFKTLRICVPQQGTDTQIPCNSTQQCYDIANNNTGFKQSLEKLTSTNPPEFLKTKLDEVINSMFVCETTCKFKQPYGDAFGNKPANFQGCQQGEQEIKLDIHGSEAWALLNFAKQNPSLLK